MGGLDLDNILDEEAISLFNEDLQEDTSPEEKSPEQEEVKEKEDPAEVNPDSLFGDPESVGSDDEDLSEDTLSEESGSTSPNNEFFSSIAQAFAEEGILPNLDDDTIKKIKTPEDFREAINNYIKSELDEQQLRVKEALDNNVEPNVIRQYEGVISYLSSISEEDIKEESDKGEELRKRLLFQDYVNRGFDNARAEKEVNRSIKNGTDIEDALEALTDCKDFYQKSYNKLLEDAKKTSKEQERAQKERAENLRKSILDDKNKFFGDLEVDKSTRQKIFDTIAKPVYKDTETGQYLTTIQKYEKDNQDEFLVKLGLLFTLTDGFKSLDKLVDNKAKKAIRKGFKDLESKLNNTSRDAFGNLKYTSGVDDGESYLGKGIKLAL